MRIEGLTATAARPVAVELDMRAVPMLRKLDMILKAWGSLGPGQAMRITNDRKPEPLQFLLWTKENGRHEWRYEKEGPDVWVATITKLRIGAGGDDERT